MIEGVPVDHLRVKNLRYNLQEPCAFSNNFTRAPYLLSSVDKRIAAN